MLVDVCEFQAAWAKSDLDAVKFIFSANNTELIRASVIIN
jgi:hypothetical protein